MMILCNIQPSLYWSYFLTKTYKTTLWLGYSGCQSVCSTRPITKSFIADSKKYSRTASRYTSTQYTIDELKTKSRKKKIAGPRTDKTTYHFATLQPRKLSCVYRRAYTKWPASHQLLPRCKQHQSPALREDKKHNLAKDDHWSQ